MSSEINPIESNLKPLNSSDFLSGVVEGFYGRPWSLEQRKDLFSKLQKFGMNTYLYAPKDDLKHRACWRELYSVEEAEQLSNLMKQAKHYNILFIYAISPGLDINYSNSKDVQALKRKLDQVKQLGDSAFALLFDDIEPELNETDKERFNSFASAQVSVTNEVYQHLGQPIFLFCPTEYCSSRAIPSVIHSEYLTTIGSKLTMGIDVMWTGTRVISQTIRLSQIQELSEVLRRKPIIWDNLHANDYDQKRLFLGPYSGRSTKLIANLKGVLTNPNCEYEANFIPIHTLSQWIKCSSDANENVCSDIKLESELENGSFEDIPTELNSTTYHPKNALRISIKEWISEFYRDKSPSIKSGIGPTTTFEQVMISNNDGKANIVSDTNIDHQNESSSNNKIEVEEDNLVNKENIQQSLEPMDCNPSPELSPKLNSLDVPMMENLKEESNVIKSMTSVESSEEMQTEVEPFQEADELSKTNNLTYDDVSLLVDLFYLPFEHGSQGVQILHEFHWLKSNGYIVSDYRRKRNNELVATSEVNEWYERASKFNDITHKIGRLLTRLTFCKNRSLLYELYPYVWDIKGVISLLNSYVKWIGFSKGYKEAFKSGEQEPWLFRGGLTGELQRLLPVETVSDLFSYTAPNSPTCQIYTIRPYLPADQLSVYEVCYKNFQRYLMCMDDQQALIGDKFVGGFLTLSPEYCFVVEDDSGLCGYALAVLDAKSFYSKLEVSWIPELLRKYPLPTTTTNIDQQQISKPIEQFLLELHNNYKNIYSDPDVIFKNHSSLLNLTVMSSIMDLSVPKRMLACVIAALKANGSKGVYCRIPNNDKKLLDFYTKLGFQTLQLSNATEKDDLYVGRII